MLFHEDGKVDEWLEYEWANNAIHIASQKQTKWCVNWEHDPTYLPVVRHTLYLFFFIRQHPKNPKNP